MEMEIVKFNPTIATIKEAVTKVEGLKIKGVEDVAGYEAVKAGKKTLADYRIEITKFGKSKRDFYNAANKEILRQEHALLDMIEPEESRLKAELEAVDEEKKKQERIVLLPGRKKMLEELAEFTLPISDQEILAMDEKEFSEYYTAQKMIFVEAKEKALKAKEDEIKRAEELEKAKKEAAENARIEAERKAAKEKQEAIDKIRGEQEEKERLEKESEALRVKKESERLAAIKVEQERTEKNKKYKAFLKKNGYTEETKSEFYISREENTFTLYKKIDSITIK